MEARPDLQSRVQSGITEIFSTSCGPASSVLRTSDLALTAVVGVALHPGTRLSAPDDSWSFVVEAYANDDEEGR